MSIISGSSQEEDKAVSTPGIGASYNGHSPALCHELPMENFKSLDGGYWRSQDTPHAEVRKFPNP